VYTMDWCLNPLGLTSLPVFISRLDKETTHRFIGGDAQMNIIVQTIIKTIGWLCRIIGVWTFFAGLLGVYAAGLTPVTLLIPVALYALGSWLVEGKKLFTFRWK
jgi:hypothetical protein